MRQRRPEPGGESNDVATALYSLAAVAVRRMPRDISLTAAATLHTLERHGPQRLTQLASIEGVTQPTMTVLVTRLERGGLAERRSAPTDRRAVVVALTAAGKRCVRRRRQVGAASLAALIAELPTDQAAALRGALPAIASLCEAAHRDAVVGSELVAAPAGGGR